MHRCGVHRRIAAGVALSAAYPFVTTPAFVEGGEAWRGVAWRGVAWRGVARCGVARRGAAGLTRTAASARAKRPIAKVCAHERRMTSAQKFAPSAEGDVDMLRRMSLHRLLIAQGEASSLAMRARARLHRDELLSASLEVPTVRTHRSGICETMVQVFAFMPCENGGTMICRNATNRQRATANKQRATCNSQHATANTQRATCNSQRATANTQRATANMQRATANMQHATANMQRATAKTRTAICHQAATLWLRSQKSQGLHTHPRGLAYCRAWERLPRAADEVAIAGQGTPRLFLCCTSCAIRRGPAASERSRNGSGAAVATASRNDCAVQCAARGCGAEQTDPTRRLSRDGAHTRACTRVCTRVRS